jgi:hypothetical protein
MSKVPAFNLRSDYTRRYQFNYFHYYVQEFARGRVNAIELSPWDGTAAVRFLEFGEMI